MKICDCATCKFVGKLKELMDEVGEEDQVQMIGLLMRIGAEEALNRFGFLNALSLANGVVSGLVNGAQMAHLEKMKETEVISSHGKSICRRSGSVG